MGLPAQRRRYGDRAEPEDAVGVARAAATGGGRSRGARRLRAALLCVVVLLFALSIPWYRTSGETTSVIFGLPDWVAVALGCYLGVALLNAIAWLLTEIPERVETRGEGERR